MDKFAMEIAISFLGDFPRGVQIWIMSEGARNQMPCPKSVLRRALLESMDKFIPEHEISRVGSSSYRPVLKMIDNPPMPKSKLAQKTLSQCLRWSTKVSAMDTAVSFLSSFTPDGLREIIGDLILAEPMPLNQAVRRSRIAHLKRHPPTVGNDEEVGPLFEEGLNNGCVWLMKHSVEHELRMNLSGLRTIHALFPLKNRCIEGQARAPLVKIAELFHVGRAPANATVETFDYLLDRGAKVDALSASDLPGLPLPSLHHASLSMLPVIDHLTEMMKWAGRGKRWAHFARWLSLRAKKVPSSTRIKIASRSRAAILDSRSWFNAG
ncbi:hypothetical protein ACHAPT_005294 [Fusarium lateritium]